MKRLSIFFGFVLILSAASTAGFAADGKAGHAMYKAELSGQNEVPSVTTNATGEAVFMMMPAGSAGKGTGGPGETGGAGPSGGAAKSDNMFYSGILDKGGSTVEAAGTGAGGGEKSLPAAGIYYSGILDKGQGAGEVPTGAGAGGTEKPQPAGIFYSGIVDRQSTGEAAGSGAGGTAGDVLHFKLDVKDMENVTAAHLHMGKKETASAEAPVIMPLYSGPQKTGQFSGTLAEGALSAKDLKGPMSGKSIHDLIAMINKGEVFVNVHTAGNPGGEIRGEVKQQ